MDLFCSCKAQQCDDTPACGPPHDGIVDQNDFFAFYRVRNGGEFDIHLPGPVARRDKRSADILVFDKTDLVGNTGRAAVTEGGVKPGIGNADHDIRLYGMALCQYRSGVYPCRVHRPTVDHRIGAGKVNVFKNAEFLFPLPAMLFSGNDPVFSEDQNLTRLNVPNECCADSGKRAAFRCDNVHAV